MTNREQNVLVVRSITYAMKGQKQLERYGYSAYIERLSHPNSRQGCGYGIKVFGPLAPALEILNAAGVPVAEVQGGQG